MGNGSRGLKLLDLGRKHRKNDSLNFPDFDEAGHSTWLSSDCWSPSMLSFDGSDASSGVSSSESGDSCWTLSTQGDSATDIWVSSLDLDVEDSELVQCAEQGSSVFGSDFPSPSVARSDQSLLRLGPDSDSNEEEEEEALFWPFDQKPYVLRDDFQRNFLCVSPRRDLRSVGDDDDDDEGLERPKPIGPGLVLERTTYRKITISPPAGTTAPSRLSRSSRAGEPLPDLEMDIYRGFLAAAQGAAIETLVGLNEFDGHEGIGAGCGDGDDNELVLD